MVNTPSEVQQKLLDSGIVKFPPNVHGIYVDRQESGNTVLTVRQNDARLSFVLDDEACAHLAGLLTKKGRP
jgi:hypothetical protein